MKFALLKTIDKYIDILLVKIQIEFWTILYISQFWIENLS